MVTMEHWKTQFVVPNRKDTFRSKIELAYNTIKKQQEEKEAQDLL